MVRSLLLFLCCSLYGFCEEATISVSGEWNAISENTPFTVIINITHAPHATIDAHSFQMKGKPITPQLVHASPTLSSFALKLPGLPGGLQTLSPITVMVDGKRYVSSPIALSVKSIHPGTITPSLTIEPLFTGKLPLYPGQEAIIGYRYTFNTNIDLTEEVLPLLEATGFKKLGEKQADEGEKNGVSEREITQKIRALKPGTFTFSPTTVKGYAYTLDAKGNKQYRQPLLLATIREISFTVAPFPAVNRPPSFNGALGNYHFTTQLLTPPQASVGDSLLLQLVISGNGEFDSVNLPSLCCQPGFSGFFTLSDLPPIVETKADSKTFQVRLFVENPQASQIPAFEFSAFDPTTKTYNVSKSAEIPLFIKSTPLINQPLSTYSLSIPTLPNSFALQWSRTFPITLFKFSLFIMVCGCLYAFYWYYKSYNPFESVPLSHILYKQALEAQHDPSLYYALLEKALQQKLKEINEADEKRGPIQTSFNLVEEKRYSAHSVLTIEDIQKSTRGLFA